MIRQVEELTLLGQGARSSPQVAIQQVAGLSPPAYRSYSKRLHPLEAATSGVGRDFNPQTGFGGVLTYTSTNQA